jgi:hypothetical protein
MPYVPNGKKGHKSSKSSTRLHSAMLIILIMEVVRSSEISVSISWTIYMVQHLRRRSSLYTSL